MILSCYIIFIQLMFGQNQDHTMWCDVRWPGWSCRVCEATRQNVKECSCMWDWLHQQAYGYVSRQNNHAVHCDVQNMGWWLPPQNPEEAFCCAWWFQAHNEEMCEYSFLFCTFFSSHVIFLPVAMLQMWATPCFVIAVSCGNSCHVKWVWFAS